MKLNFFFNPLLKTVLSLALPLSVSQPALHAEEEGVYKRGGTYLERITPPTPEASSVTRYSDVPFDHATGSFGLHVPLVTLRGKSLDIPISLSYVGGNGIKLDEVAGVAGLGWSLSAGGCVTRAVMDMPDELSSAGMRHQLPSRALLSKLDSGVEDTETVNYLIDVCRHGVDASLDRYAYNVRGLSGEFVIDDGGEVVQLSGEGVRIAYVRPASGAVTSFTITGPDGVVYVFSEKEFTTHERMDGSLPGPITGSPDVWTAPTAWYVSSITSADGLDTATFTYTDGYDWKRSRVSRSQTRVVTSTAAGSPSVSVLTVSETWTTKQLSGVTLSGGTAEFTYQSLPDSRTGHQDVESYNYPAALRGLEIRNHLGETLMSYSFNTGLDPNDGRVVLGGINRLDRNGTRDDYWRFDYNTLTSPVSHLSQDWYGYYNGTPNASGVGICPFTFSVSPTATQGVPDAVAAKYMSLRKVERNGAFTGITYEGNECGGRSVGVRVSELTICPNDTDYILAEGKRYRRFGYAAPVASGPVEPSMSMYMGTRAPLAEGDAESLSATWSFMLHETPLSEGPSIRDTRVYYGEVTETLSQESALSNPAHGKTVLYFDTSLARVKETNVFGKFPSGAAAKYAANPPVNNIIDPYLGVRHFYSESGPAADVPLLRREEYAVPWFGPETLVSVERYVYDTPSTREVLVSYQAEQVWHRMSLGDILMEDIHHYPVYARSYPGRVPVRKTRTLYHELGAVTETTSYAYKIRGLNLEEPVRLSSETFRSGRLGHRLEYAYADDLAGEPALTNVTRLVSAHVLSPRLRTRYYVTKYPAPSAPTSSPPWVEPIPADCTKLWKTGELQYKDFYIGGKNVLMPSSHVERTNGDVSWREDILSRDSKGNISSWKQRGGAETVLVWGYGGRYPVAVIENATLQQVSSALSGLGVSVASITLSPDLSETMSAALESLRTLLPSSLVRTYRHVVGVGPSRMVDENGTVTNYEYDGSGRLVSIKDAQGNPVEGYEYDLLKTTSNSGCLSVRSKSYLSENGGTFRESVKWWNTLGVTLEEIAVGASGTGKDLVTAHESDFLMRDDARVWLPYPVANTGGSYQSDAPSQSASYHSNTSAYFSRTYEDSRVGRLVSTARPGYAGWHEKRHGRSAAESFPDLLWPDCLSGSPSVNYPDSTIICETVTDEDGREVHTWRDRLGRVLATGNGDDNPSYYIYDRDSQLRSIVGSGIQLTDTLNTWRFGYDSIGRLTSRGVPGRQRERYAYDDNDRIKTETRPDGVREYEYDALGRIVKVYARPSGATSRTLVEEYSYTGGLRTSGRHAEYGDGGPTGQYAEEAYTYDAKGRLTGVTTDYPDGSVLTEDYTYSFNGDLSRKITVHDGAGLPTVRLESAYERDLMSRPMKVTDALYSGGTLKSRVVSDHAYDELGRPQTVTTGACAGTSPSPSDCMTETYGYNLQGLMTSKGGVRTRMSSPTAADGYQFSESLSYTYAGLVSRIEESGTLADAVKEYSYDSNGRLSKDRVDGVERSYLYDPRGNVISDGAKFYTYDGDRLAGCSGGGVTWTFAHDNMGRMTSDGHSGTAISYNMIDLPSKITKSDGSVVKYSYLADGRKISSLTGEGIGLVYRGPFVYRRDASGALTFESASCEGGRLEPDAAYRHVTDHLGSTRAVARMDTYAVGDIVDYSSYGERTQVSGVSQTRLYFTGKEDQSVDFGLPYVDFGARHYSPGLHRWLVPDPLAQDTPTVSAYAYCANNPISFVDPDGRDVWEIDEMGRIVNRIKDKTQDSFQIVRKDENGDWRRTKQSISFEYGTVQAVRNPNVTGTDDRRYSLTVFEVKNDDNAKDLFEFMANPEVTSVEWEHIKIGTSDSGRNIVGNSHTVDKTAVLGYLWHTKYTLREANHNHPSGAGPSEEDLFMAKLIQARQPNCLLNVYVHPGTYISFDKNTVK